MGDTWIVDMSHFDYRDEEAQGLPSRALRLSNYFGTIVRTTCARLGSDSSTGLRCRRRPNHLPCPGYVQSHLDEGGKSLRWWCSVCGDNGRISNWEGTRWDPFRSTPLYHAPYGLSAPASIEEPDRSLSSKPIDDRSRAAGELSGTVSERIVGTIEWDEGCGGLLPKIVTRRKTYTWEELGEELMTYEGFRIAITLG